jgi:hypothetical protein
VVEGRVVVFALVRLCHVNCYNGCRFFVDEMKGYSAGIFGLWAGADHCAVRALTVVRQTI